MDDFREWLSDNLRYFILGGAILLVVLVLFFGVRACVGKKDDGKNVQQTGNEQQDDNASQTDETDSGEENANPLVKASEEVKALTEKYYEALGNKDVEALKTFVENLSPTEETKITNARYIEGYTVGDIYTKKGLEKDAYVVYASYTYQCTGIATPVPGLSLLYVYPDSEGSLKIDGGALEDTQIYAYTEKLSQDEDVVALEEKINKELEDAKAGDTALADFLSGLGEDADGSAVAAAGTTLTANDNCNVRAAADGEAEIIGGLDVGTQVEKLGAEGEWIQIEYEGQTGYVHNSLLD